jgi:hypothetical protein
MRGRRGGGELVDDLPMAIAIEQHAERIKNRQLSQARAFAINFNARPRGDRFAYCVSPASSR